MVLCIIQSADFINEMHIHNSKNVIGVAYRSIISRFCLQHLLSTLLKFCKKTAIFRAKYVC